MTDSPGLPSYGKFFAPYDPHAVVERAALRFGLYARISSAADTTGVDRQIREGLEFLPKHPWLKDRRWQVIDHYIDNDVSAHDVRLNRPQFTRLLDDLRTGRINAIWCYDYDRLARQEIDAALIKRDLELFDGELVLTNKPGENYDARTGEGRQMWQFKTVMADNEVRQTKDRQKLQRKEKVEKGAFNGGRRRYGYDKTMTEIVPEEAEIIREMADRMLKGESVSSLARELNRRSAPTPLGGKWVATNLQRCVTGPHVVGLRLAYGGIAPAPASWPSILDEKTWHRLQELVNDPARKRGLRKGRPKRVSPLTGLMRCGRCGRILRSQRVVRNGNANRYWQCNSPEGCKRVNRSDRKLSLWIESEILAAYDDPAFVHRLLIAGDGGPTHEDLFTQKQEAERRINELDADYYDPPTGQRRMDRTLYEGIRTKFQRTIDDCEIKLQSLSAKQDVDVELVSSGRLRELWPDLSIEERHTIIRFAVRRVVLSREVRNQSQNPEDHYTIVWADAPDESEGSLRPAR